MTLPGANPAAQAQHRAARRRMRLSTPRSAARCCRPSRSSRSSRCGNRRTRGMDFRVPGRLAVRHLRHRLQDADGRRIVVRHLVHPVRSHPRLCHRDHLRVAARTGALVFGVRRPTGRALHRCDQQRAEDRAGADRRAVVRHRPHLKGRAVGIADRDRRADCRLSGRQGCRRRSAVAADLDGRRQAPGILQGGSAVDPALDHRDIPHQYRFWPGRRGGRRVHLIAARARSSDLHRFQPLRPQHRLGRPVHADDHGLRRSITSSTSIERTSLPWKQSSTTHQIQV